MCCDICAFRRFGSFERIQRAVVHICLQVPHPLLVHYSHQVLLASMFTATTFDLLPSACVSIWTWERQSTGTY